MLSILPCGIVVFGGFSRGDMGVRGFFGCIERRTAIRVSIFKLLSLLVIAG